MTPFLEPLARDWQALLTAGVAVCTLAILLFGQRAPDMAMVGGVIVLLVAGVLTPDEAFKGMSNEGMLTVAALFVVAAAVERTGALATVVDRALGRPQSLASAQLRTMAAPAAVSAFMNNTPVVALMVPAIRDWAKKHRLSVSKLLMPMNAAVILGGLCTLIGTSTNIVVSGLFAAKAGRTLGMFEITWLGVPLLAVGFVYLTFASRSNWLLRDRRPAMSSSDDPRQYSLEMLVEPGSPLVGRSIEEAGLRGLEGLFLMEIDRGGHVMAAVAPTERLEAGDRLVFVGVVDSVVELQKIRGLRPATDQLFQLDGPRSERVLVEAVVSNSCPLVGSTIRAGRFRSTYDAVVIAVARNGERLAMKIGDIVLEPGDTLLLEASPAFFERQRSNRDFYLVSEVSGSTPPRHDQAWIACTVLAAMVLAATLELVPMVAAAFCAAAVVVATGCISANEARRSIEWESLLLIAASFGLARAMEKTGLDEAIARSTIAAAGDHPHVVLAAIYFVTMLFTELMSNNAAAVLVFPIAWQTAADMGLNPLPFVMAVTVAASCGFATPMGYQTNLMIYGPGGYKFSDYVRFGGLLNLLVMAATVILAPLIWPFTR
ncbi:MAG: SLC13 family permease [Planctomycetia bacterium]|nr:SLC13 family permease [Planctomycetia bacterium]